MHTVELLEQALHVARRLGYRIRQEWLGGQAAGFCEFAGQRWIFVDLSATTADQLFQVTQVLRADPRIAGMSLSPPLRRLVAARRAA